MNCLYQIRIKGDKSEVISQRETECVYKHVHNSQQGQRLFDQSNVSSNKICITTATSNAKMKTRLTSDSYVDVGLAEWIEHPLLGLNPAVAENTTSLPQSLQGLSDLAHAWKGGGVKPEKSDFYVNST